MSISNRKARASRFVVLGVVVFVVGLAGQQAALAQSYDEDFETGNLTKWAWSTSSSAWAVSTTDKHGGTYSAKAGGITHNQSTSLQISLTRSAGSIKFYRRVSSESGCDYLKFYVDSSLQSGASWSGTTEGWVQQTYTVTAGSHIYKWEYSKDGSVNTGSDTAWIDDITFPPSPVTYSIAGKSTHGSAGLAGVTITATGGATATTDSSGSFTVAGLAAGTYTITPSKTGYAFAPSSTSVTVGPDAAGIEFTAGSSGGGSVYDEDFETGNSTKWPWTSGGNQNWAVTTTDKHGGTYSAKAGAITHSQSTYLQVTLTRAAGTISYYRRVSSEAYYDKLHFYIDGVEQGTALSGTQAWAQQSFSVTASSHTYKWEYSKDSTGTSGSDTAWIDDINFPPAVAATYSISGKVSLGNAGLAGVTVTATGGANATTDSSGNYTITGLAGGTYTVTPSKTGYAFGPSCSVVVGPNATGVNFVAGTASGSLYDEDFETSGLTKWPWTTGGSQNWGVTTSDKHGGTYSAQAGAITHNQSTYLQVTLTRAAGSISFYRKVSSQASGDYLRFYIDGTEQGTGWSGTQAWAQQTYTVAAGSHVYKWQYSKNGSTSSGSDTAWIDDINFPPPSATYSISGKVTCGGTALAGVTVTPSSGTAATSAADGTYTITDLAAGTYTLTPTKTNYVFAPTSLAVTVGPSSVGGKDFVGTYNVFSITGAVSPRGVNLISAGVTITVTGGATATTNTYGDYTITGLPGGTYTVTPSKAGCWFSPLSSSVTLGPDATEVNFSAYSMATMDPEPTYTAGTSNTVSWGTACGAAEYMVDCSNTPPAMWWYLSSGWVTTRSYTFYGLQDGQTYYYFVIPRDASGDTSRSWWSEVVSSTQDASAPISSASAPAAASGSTFTVTLTASDATSGVALTRLYYRYEGGAWTEYGSGYSGGSNAVSFTAAANGTYEFYTVATDNVGNAEAAPASADCSTEVLTLSVPVMDAEPATTPGTTNTVSWSAVPGATDYEAQCSSTSGFTAGVTSSGWVAATSYTFSGLTIGTKYYYRVRARVGSGGAVTAWTQTSQADFGADTLNQVATTISPGNVVLRGTGTGGAEITGVIRNPSFESGGDWLVSGHGDWNRHYITTATLGAMPTAGSSHLELIVDGLDGDYLQYSQSVDLTGVGAIRFDAELYGGPNGTYASAGEVRIDGVVKWRQQSPGQYLNQTLDVSSYAGTHTIELRAEQWIDRSGTPIVSRFMWDNFRTYGTSAYTTSGTVTSTAIAPASLGKWGTLSFTKATPAGTTLTVDVLNGSGGTLLTNVSSGTDLDAAGITASSLKLRANLATTNTAITPALSDWTVTYEVRSAWSGSVFSTQTVPVEPAPLILSGPKVTKITRTAAVVNWNTNVPSSSLLGFDTVSRASYGLYATFTSGPGGLTSHSVKLAGLQPSTRYYLRVRSTDSYGRSVDSGEVSFTTATLAQPTLTYTGATTGTNAPGETVTLAATLKDGTTALAGRTIAFVCGDFTGSATTDASGVASVVVATTRLGTGVLTVSCRFAGDGTHLPATATGTLTITNLSIHTIVRGSGYFYKGGDLTQRCAFSFRFDVNATEGWLRYSDVRAHKQILVNDVSSIVLSPDAARGPQAAITCGVSGQYKLTVNASTRAFSIREGSVADPTYSASTSRASGQIVIEEAAP